MKRFLSHFFIVLSLILASLACNVPQLPPAVPHPNGYTHPNHHAHRYPPAYPYPGCAMPTLIPPTATPEVTVSPYQPAGYYVVPPTGGQHPDL